MFLAALVAAAAGTACGGGHARPPEADEAPSVTADLAVVTDDEVRSTFEAGGVVMPRQAAAVAARVMAPITAVRVRVGDRVRRGAVLITLDARELDAHAARATASLRAAQEAAEAAAAQERTADAGLALARATFERIKGLHDRQSATAQERDQAVAALQAAEAQQAGARAQARSASFAQDAARAGADAGAVGQSYAVLTAPFDGRVTSRAADPGVLAMPGVPLLVLEEDGPVRLEASLDETRAGTVEVGQPVDVRLDRVGGWRPGSVAEIGRLDAGSHSFVVKIDFAADPAARTGAFGRVRVAGEPRRARRVPSTSLVRRGQLAFVFVADEAGRARLRPVTPGPSDGDRVEVLAGLAAGEHVLVAPPASLRDGARLAGSNTTGGGTAAAPASAHTGDRP